MSTKLEPTNVTNRAACGPQRPGRHQHGGDAVGRDKIIVNNYNVTIQSDGRADLTGDLVRLQPPGKVEVEPAKKKASRHGKTTYRRERLYRLNLRGDYRQILEGFTRWRIVVASVGLPPENQPIATLANEVVGIGLQGVTTFCSPPVPEIKNCSVQCKLKIIADGGDASNWAGIRLRGFLDDIQFGYLIYLRRRGSVELYRVQQVIAGLNRDIVDDPADVWTQLRVDIFNSRIAIWVNREALY